MAVVAHGAPLSLGVGNAMQPEVHATGLVPMITGTNVPEDEEEIEAPIYDQDEIDKVKGLVKQTIDSKGDLSKAPILKNVDPNIMATADTIRASGAVGVFGTDNDMIFFATSSGPIFTLPAGIPTVALMTTTTAKA